VTLALVILLILVMPTQIGFVLPIGESGLPVTVADVVLVLALVGVALRLFSGELRGVKFPPLQAFVLVAAALVALARTEAKLDAAKEVLQLIECFLVAFAVFVNVAESSDLKPCLAAFAAACAIVVVWGGYQYLSCESALDVRAGYVRGNRNLLGAFLALSLPMLYGIALHARFWRHRLVLLAIVVVGLLINLSGGALLVTLLVLGILSALRGQRALVPYFVLLCLGLVAAPSILPRPYHTDAVFSSVAPYVSDNFLLSDYGMVTRAKELLHPTKQIVIDDSGAKGLPDPRPPYAKRLLVLLNKRRQLSPEEMKLLGEIDQAIQADVPAEDFPLAKPQVARRYQRWNAAVLGARKLCTSTSKALFGHGFAPYQDLLKPFWSERLLERTDEPELFNVGAPEPFTHNMWLKALLQTGLVGLFALAWLIGTFIHRAARLYREARSELILGVALGSIGSILGFALVGIFTEGIVRGLTIPFVFVLAAVAIAERIVRGEGETVLGQLTRRD